MLTLTRNVGETIIIGDNITVTVTEVRGNTVRLSIGAPREVKILREEVHQRINQAEQIAAQVARDAVAALAAAGTPNIADIPVGHSTSENKAAPDAAPKVEDESASDR